MIPSGSPSPAPAVTTTDFLCDFYCYDTPAVMCERLRALLAGTTPLVLASVPDALKSRLEEADIPQEVRTEAAIRIFCAGLVFLEHALEREVTDYKKEKLCWDIISVAFDTSSLHHEDSLRTRLAELSLRYLEVRDCSGAADAAAIECIERTLVLIEATMDLTMPEVKLDCLFSPERAVHVPGLMLDVLERAAACRSIEESEVASSLIEALGSILIEYDARFALVERFKHCIEKMLSCLRASGEIGSDAEEADDDENDSLDEFVPDAVRSYEAASQEDSEDGETHSQKFSLTTGALEILAHMQKRKQDFFPFWEKLFAEPSLAFYALYGMRQVRYSRVFSAISKECPKNILQDLLSPVWICFLRE